MFTWLYASTLLCLLTKCQNICNCKDKKKLKSSTTKLAGYLTLRDFQFYVLGWIFLKHSVKNDRKQNIVLWPRTQVISDLFLIKRLWDALDRQNQSLNDPPLNLKYLKNMQLMSFYHTVAGLVESITLWIRAANEWLVHQCSYLCLNGINKHLCVKFWSFIIFYLHFFFNSFYQFSP